MEEKMSLPSLDGGFRMVPVPTPQDNFAMAEQIFERGCKTIADGWIARQKEKDTNATRWLHTVSYNFLSRTMSNGFSDLIEMRITGYGASKRGKYDVVNPFQRGLLALFVHEDDCFDIDERARVGKRLWFAYRHYVPVEFLLGFLEQYWKKKDAAQRAVTTSILPDFLEWIFFHRINDERPEVRGEYPSHLEKPVRNLKPLSRIIAADKKRKARARAQRLKEDT